MANIMKSVALPVVHFWTPLYNLATVEIPKCSTSNRMGQKGEF